MRMSVSFKKALIPAPGIVRLTWETLDLPGDAPRISDGDTFTRKLDGDRRTAMTAAGVLDWERVDLVQERFQRKGDITTYQPTIEFSPGDGSDADLMMRRILAHDLSGDLMLIELQIDLPLYEERAARLAGLNLPEIKDPAQALRLDRFAREMEKATDKVECFERHLDAHPEDFTLLKVIVAEARRAKAAQASQAAPSAPQTPAVDSQPVANGSEAPTVNAAQDLFDAVEGIEATAVTDSTDGELLTAGERAARLRRRGEVK